MRREGPGHAAAWRRGSPILGHAQLLTRAGSPEQAESRVHAVVANVRRMDVMIQDLVDSARPEAGQLQMDLAPVDLYDLVPRLVKEQVGAEAGRMRLKLPLETGVPNLDLILGRGIPEGDALPPGDRRRPDGHARPLLTSLRGYAELTMQRIAEGRVEDVEDVRGALLVIMRQADRLSNLVTQLLDMPGIDAGELALSAGWPTWCPSCAAWWRRCRPAQGDTPCRCSRPPRSRPL